MLSFGVTTKMVFTPLKVDTLGCSPSWNQPTLILIKILGLGFGTCRYQRNTNSLFG